MGESLYNNFILLMVESLYNIFAHNSYGWKVMTTANNLPEYTNSYIKHIFSNSVSLVLIKIYL